MTCMTCTSSGALHLHVNPHSLNSLHYLLIDTLASDIKRVPRDDLFLDAHGLRYIISQLSLYVGSIVSLCHLRGMYTLSREAAMSNCFQSRLLFRKDLLFRKKKRKVPQIVFLINNRENLLSLSCPLNVFSV